MKLEAYWILQNLASSNLEDIKIILGETSYQIEKGEILRILASEL
jgi:hypothetical protein